MSSEYCIKQKKDIYICFHACKSNYIHFWAILSIWYPNEYLKISALIPKIHDFVVLRSMRSLNVNSLDKNIIFYCQLDQTSNSWKECATLWRGAWRGATYALMDVKVKFLFQNRHYDVETGHLVNGAPHAPPPTMWHVFFTNSMFDPINMKKKMFLSHEFMFNDRSGRNTTKS